MKRSPLLLALLATSLGATSWHAAMTSTSYAMETARNGALATPGERAAVAVRTRPAGALATAAQELSALILPVSSGLAPERDARVVASIRATLRAHAAGTYMDEMLVARDSALARWPERAKDPVRVWIQPASAVADWSPAFVTAVQTAFQNWNDVELPVRFALVADSSDAEVQVKWIDHFNEQISGRTRWARDGEWWITDGSISLAVHHHDGDLLDPESMHAMALHEIGHLIGLDHTTDSGSIMAPRVRVRDLSDADRATAHLLYTVLPGELR